MSYGKELQDAAERLYESRRGWWSWLVLLFVAAVLLRLACYTGIVGSDDLWYARYAEQIASGDWPHQTNQFAGRVGITAAVAVLYRVFGVSEFTTELLPLLASSAAVPLLAAIGARLYGPVAGSIAALLLLTSPIHVRFATILVPEPMMEFWILAAVWCYLEVARRDSPLLGLVAGAAVGVAYLTKEPAAFVVPALAITAWSTGRRRLAVTVAAGALVVLGLETVTYAVVLHDPLHRIEAARVGVSTVTTADVSHRLTSSTWLRDRLFRTYPRRMIYPTLDFGLHYLFGLVFAGIAVLSLRRDRLLLVLWAVLPWAFLNFGSASLAHYAPLDHSERYISLTLPPLFVLAAALVAVPAAHFARARAAGLVLLVVVGVVGVGCGLTLRDTGFRVREMATLRSIANMSSAKGMIPCHVPDGQGSSHVRTYGHDRVDFWTDGLRLFHPRPAKSAPAHPQVRIGEDVLGLPRVDPGTCDDDAAAHEAGDGEGTSQ